MTSSQDGWHEKMARMWVEPKGHPPWAFRLGEGARLPLGFCPSYGRGIGSFEPPFLLLHRGASKGGRRGDLNKHFLQPGSDIIVLHDAVMSHDTTMSQDSITECVTPLARTQR